MCTVFTDKEVYPTFLAKNYDCFIEGGMLFINHRGKKKHSLVLPSQKELSWESSYGSVTFSQSGKGMPVNGINEKGLIVEQATCLETVYPEIADQPIISCLETIQYLLDTCENIKQAVEAFHKFCISNTSGKLHYFLMDATGEKAIIEFLHGMMRVFPLKDSLPILTNSPYETVCQGKNTYSSAYEENSYKRWNCVGTMINRMVSKQDAFHILEAAKREDTQWSVVYDIREKKLLVRVKEGIVKTISLDDINYAKGAPSYLYDLESEGAFSWTTYTRERNRKYIERTYGNPRFLQMLHLSDPEFMINAFDEHIQTIEDMP